MAKDSSRDFVSSESRSSALYKTCIPQEKPSRRPVPSQIPSSVPAVAPPKSNLLSSHNLHPPKLEVRTKVISLRWLVVLSRNRNITSSLICPLLSGCGGWPPKMNHTSLSIEQPTAHLQKLGSSNYKFLEKIVVMFSFFYNIQHLCEVS